MFTLQKSIADIFLYIKAKGLIRTIIQIGLIKTIKILSYELFFDFFHKVDTGGIIWLSGLNTKSEMNKYHRFYQPSSRIILEQTFNFLSKNYNLKDSSLLDYGCGKGRVLIYACLTYNLKNLVGVEFANELFNIATENVKSLGLNNISLFNQDAIKFIIPSNIDIFYFYNPFVGMVFREVLKKIREHVYKQNDLDKKILIVYGVPVCKDMFDVTQYKIVYEIKNEIMVFETSKKLMFNEISIKND